MFNEEGGERRGTFCLQMIFTSDWNNHCSCGCSEHCERARTKKCPYFCCLDLFRELRRQQVAKCLHDLRIFRLCLAVLLAIDLQRCTRHKHRQQEFAQQDKHQTVGVAVQRSNAVATAMGADQNEQSACCFLPSTSSFFLLLFRPPPALPAPAPPDPAPPAPAPSAAPAPPDPPDPAPAPPDPAPAPPDPPSRHHKPPPSLSPLSPQS
eukprot:757632-Hanusia_phi.AAC.1